MRPPILTSLLIGSCLACADVPAGPRAPMHATIPPADSAPVRYDAPFGLVDANGRLYAILFTLTSGGAVALHSRDHEGFATTTDSGAVRSVEVVAGGQRLVLLIRPAFRDRSHPSDRLRYRCDGASDQYLRAAAALIDAARQAGPAPAFRARRQVALLASRFDDAWQKWRHC